MKCPKCKHDNPEVSSFFNACGDKLEITCPECAKSNHPESKFCNACGKDLRGHLKTSNFSEPKSYTPKFIANKILSTRSAIEGERKIVTVLFADVANFISY